MDNVVPIPRNEDDEIIVIRPENMSYEEYKERRREQSKRLKKRLKQGVLIHKSSETFKDPETGETGETMIRKYRTPYLSPSKQARKALKEGNNGHTKINLELKQ